MQNRYKIAIVGATGVVGRTVLKVLEEKSFYNCVPKHLDIRDSVFPSF